jgi:small conductance mechanosensitive channel
MSSNQLLQWLQRYSNRTAWDSLLDRLPSIIIGLIVTGVVFFVGRFLLRFLLNQIFHPIIERERAANSPRIGRLITLKAVTQSFFNYALYFIVLCLFLNAFGQNPASLIATAGVAGVAIGFGAQKFVRDVVTGFLLLLEDQFAVGDFVAIGANMGIIEETGMRITKIRDDSGRLIILSNGDITQVINYSKGGYKATVDVSVSSETGMETMQEVVQDAARKLESAFEDDVRPVLRGIVGMSAASITYRVDLSSPAVQRLEAETRFREALRESLSEKDVKIV